MYVLTSSGDSECLVSKMGTWAPVTPLCDFSHCSVFKRSLPLSSARALFLTGDRTMFACQHMEFEICVFLFLFGLDAAKQKALSSVDMQIHT